eukprot:14170081-Ditylum_brightwellii.AAC.1
MIRERKEIVHRIITSTAAANATNPPTTSSSSAAPGEDGTNDNAAAATAAATQAVIAKSLSSHKNIVQYASILLSMLHSKFGDVNLASAATNEAVRVAQQG